MSRPFQRARPVAAERPRQETPAEIVGELLGVIRGQFYGDTEAKRWFQDQHFIKRNVVLWPATWLDKRGVTLAPARYRAILMEIFQGIKRHGETGAVKYWPAYLMRCVQEHFRHNEDALYEEAKAVRTQVESAMRTIQRLKDATPASDPIQMLAQTRAVLQSSRRHRVKPEAAQGLLGI